MQLLGDPRSGLVIPGDPRLAQKMGEPGITWAQGRLMAAERIAAALLTKSREEEARGSFREWWLPSCSRLHFL